MDADSAGSPHAGALDIVAVGLHSQALRLLVNSRLSSCRNCLRSLGDSIGTQTLNPALQVALHQDRPVYVVFLIALIAEIEQPAVK